MKKKFEPKWSVEECEGTYAVICDDEEEDGLGCIWDRKRAEKICKLLNQNDKEAFDSLDEKEEN